MDLHFCFVFISTCDGQGERASRPDKRASKSTRKHFHEKRATQMGYLYMLVDPHFFWISAARHYYDPTVAQTNDVLVNCLSNFMLRTFGCLCWPAPARRRPAPARAGPRGGRPALGTWPSALALLHPLHHRRRGKQVPSPHYACRAGPLARAWAAALSDNINRFSPRNVKIIPEIQPLRFGALQSSTIRA